MDHRTFNVLSLCSGVAGLELGLKRVIPSTRVVCWVEWDLHRIAVLQARMEEGRLDSAPVWTNLYTFDGKPWSGVVDCVVAGYPCQPFSVAGKQTGDDHPEHLWPQVLRAVTEVAPEWVLLENVPNHLQIGFDAVRDDLHELGYRVEAGLYSAFEAGGSHKRLRLYALCRKAVGDPHTPRLEGWSESIGERSNELPSRATGTESVPEVDQFKSWNEWAKWWLNQGNSRPVAPPLPDDDSGWARVLRDHPRLSPVIPVVRGVADGVPCWVDRIKALGEGACPTTTALAVTALMGKHLADS